MSIRYRRKRIFIPWQEHSLAVGGFFDFDETAMADDIGGMRATAAGAGIVVDSADNADEIVTTGGTATGAVLAGTGPYGLFLQSTGTGNPFATTQGTSLCTGIAMAAAGEANYFGLIPYDLDVRQNIGVRVVYTHGSATATDTVTWIVLYAGYADDAALGAPATALSTTVAVQTLTAAAARQLKRTARGIINVGGVLETDSFWGLNVEMDATDVDTTGEGVWYLGLEIDYVPRMTPNTFSVDMGIQDTRPLGD